MGDIVTRIANAIDNAYFVPGRNTYQDAVRAAKSIIFIVDEARAEERERAAQIAREQVDEYAANARDLRYCDSDRRFYAACATRLRDIAAAIRQAASGESGT